MKIEELIRLSMVNHEIDKEKIRRNVLDSDKKAREKKRIVLFAAVALLILIPAITLIFAFSGDSGEKSDDNMDFSAMSETAALSATGETSGLQINKRMIVAGGNNYDRFDYFQRKNGKGYYFMARQLEKALEEYAPEAEFLINVRYISPTITIKGISYIAFIYDYTYEGKTVLEWDNEFTELKKEYEYLLSKYKDESSEEAKNKLEEANNKLEEAKNKLEKSNNEALKALSEKVKEHFEQKGIEIISSDQKSDMIIISTKEKLFEIINELNQDEIFKELETGKMDIKDVNIFEIMIYHFSLAPVNDWGQYTESSTEYSICCYDSAD